MKHTIIGILVLALVIMLAGCGAPASEVTTEVTTEPTPALASTPAEIAEVVKVGMDKTEVTSLIDGMRFNPRAIQLSEFSNVEGQIKMVPRKQDSELPATHIVYLYYRAEVYPACVVYSMGGEWEVVYVGRMLPENAAWLIENSAVEVSVTEEP